MILCGARQMGLSSTRRSIQEHIEPLDSIRCCYLQLISQPAILSLCDELPPYHNRITLLESKVFPDIVTK